MQTGASEKWNENVLALACALVGEENLIKLVGIHRFTCYISNYLCTGAFVGYEGAVLQFRFVSPRSSIISRLRAQWVILKKAKRELKPQCEAGKRFRFIMPQTAAAVRQSECDWRCVNGEPIWPLRYKGKVLMESLWTNRPRKMMSKGVTNTGKPMFMI